MFEICIVEGFFGLVALGLNDSTVYGRIGGNEAARELCIRVYGILPRQLVYKRIRT